MISQHWRRRFFRLSSSKLTGYHEHTHQKRAVINLAKASRLVDDKRTLVADPTSANPASRNRRKSAFAEEDEGYQYVEEGFRIRFANGETIDFYADSREQKELWMQALSQVIGRPEPGVKAAKWTDLVLARERAEGVPQQPPTPANGPAVESVAPSPVKNAGVDVHDFTKPASSPAKKPVPPPRDAARSGPTSPAKRQVPPAAVAFDAASQARRPTTPPMNPRRAHRARDAVKSMIF